LSVNIFYKFYDVNILIYMLNICIVLILDFKPNEMTSVELSLPRMDFGTEEKSKKSAGMDLRWLPLHSSITVTELSSMSLSWPLSLPNSRSLFLLARQTSINSRW